MRKAAWLAGVLTLAIAVPALAQEPEEEPDVAAEEDEEDRPSEPRRRIRVLENPYDLASFYRSRQGYFGPGPGYGFAPVWTGRYPIAAFYRNEAQGYHSRFWTLGYGHGPRRPGFSIVYRRAIGDNGELCLFAPTILAPVGPLTSGLFDPR